MARLGVQTFKEVSPFWNPYRLSFHVGHGHSCHSIRRDSLMAISSSINQQGVTTVDSCIPQSYLRDWLDSMGLTEGVHPSTHSARAFLCRMQE